MTIMPSRTVMRPTPESGQMTTTRRRTLSPELTTLAFREVLPPSLEQMRLSLPQEVVVPIRQKVRMLQVLTR